MSLETASVMPVVVDQVALAGLQGEPLFACPHLCPTNLDAAPAKACKRLDVAWLRLFDWLPGMCAYIILNPVGK